MYELLYIIPAPYTETDLPKIAEKVKSEIVALGGEVKKDTVIGNIKFAYPIKKQTRGFYLLIEFALEGLKLDALKARFKLLPEIARYLIITMEPIRTKEKKRARRRIKVPGIATDAVKESKGRIDLKALGKEIEELLKI